MVTGKLPSLAHMLLTDSALFVLIGVKLDHWIVLVQIPQEGSELSIFVDVLEKELDLLEYLNEYVHLCQWEYAKVDTNYVDHSERK